MKTKKYLFLMLAATLFAACGDDNDDPDTPMPDEPDQPALIEFADYSNVIDMSYSEMIRQYPNPSMSFGDFYIYENMNDGKVASLSFIVNSDNQQVYMISEMLTENAYKEEDIVAYFASKYASYGTSTIETEDEDGNITGSITTYTFGNTDKQEDATLLIELTGNQSVFYSNPQNVPAETGGAGSLDDMTPADAVASFLLQDVEDIEDAYPDVFMQMGDMYMTFMEDNYWLAGVAFTPVDGFVTSLIILYNEDLTDEDIIAYYTDLGYTATQTGTGEDGDEYTITNGVIMIAYSGNRATITFIDED
ncbi:MAG: hypothetical protein J1E77_05685 [Prevotella sp.]|nr:hypothetical protein [Prevotella sp.]